jgi:phosphatidylcholine synthase
VLAFYFYLLSTPTAVNGLLLIFCALMVFVPIKYIYPSRTPVLRTVNIGLGFFALLIMCLIIINFDHPDPRLVYLSLIYPVYYVTLSLFLHFRPHFQSLLGFSGPHGD